MSKENILKPAIQAIRNVAREQGGERGTFHAVLSAPVMREYLAHYLSGDFYDKMQAYREKHGVPVPWPGTFKNNPYKILADDGTYWETMNDEAPVVLDNVRYYRVYPLDAQELRIANLNINETPMLSKVMAGFQAGVVSYLEEILQAVQDIQSETETDDPEGHISDEDYALSAIETAVIKMAEAAEGFSLIHDLMPIIASQLENAGEFCGNDIRKGFRRAFERSAFKSFEGPPSNPRVSRCPFSKVVVHLADTVLEKNADGFRVVPERTESGALMLFIAQRIQEIESERATIVPKPEKLRLL